VPGVDVADLIALGRPERYDSAVPWPQRGRRHVVTLTIGTDRFFSPKPHARLRRWHRVVIFIAAFTLVFAAILSVLGLWAVHGLGSALGAGVRAAVGDAEQRGAYQASAVTALAHSEGVSYGDVTILQSRYPNTHWLTATEASSPTMTAIFESPQN
jgi:hypothetical protein